MRTHASVAGGRGAGGVGRSGCGGCGGRGGAVRKRQRAAALLVAAVRGALLLAVSAADWRTLSLHALCVYVCPLPTHPPIHPPTHLLLCAVQADKFHKTGRQLRSRMWWQNMKMKLIVVFILILIAVIIFCAVCFSGKSCI